MKINASSRRKGDVRTSCWSLALTADDADDADLLTQLYRRLVFLRPGTRVRTKDGWIGEVIWSPSLLDIRVQSEWPKDGRTRKSLSRIKSYNAMDVWPEAREVGDES